MSEPTSSQEVTIVHQTEETPYEFGYLPNLQDLVGMPEITRRLIDIIDDNDPRNAAMNSRYDVRPPRRLLFVGPPGVGKTTAAQAIAKELQAGYMPVDPSDVVDSYVGNTTKNVRHIFRTAQADGEDKERLTVLFFDEFDGLFSEDAGGNKGVAKQAVDELKLILHNQHVRFPNVLTIFATNETSGINEPLLRAGRIDEMISFPKPDRDGLAQIFAALIAKHAKHFDISFPTDLTDDDASFEDYGSFDKFRSEMSALAELCENMTGANVEHIITQARLERARRHRREGVEPEKISMQGLMSIITDYRRNRPNLG
jgi:SpoVK/Ycf46/Vps4 family AAA+-type ATPase